MRQYTPALAAALSGWLLLSAALAPADEQPERPAKKAPPAASSDTAEQPDDKVKTREVKLKDLTLTVPETWKQGDPSNNLRLGEFDIPPVEDDGDEPVELTVFTFGGGGSVQQNIERWINQFDAEGRKAKVTTGESPQGRYVFVDISGTYQQPVGPPILRQTETVPEARMLAVILGIPEKGVYYLKMAGREKTVSANEQHLRRSFGGDAEKEKPLDLDGAAEGGTEP